MAKTKKNRAQQRREWERRIWSALVDYANTGERFETLLVACLDWIGGDADDLEECRDMQRGASLESLAVTYREGIGAVLAWLSVPQDRQRAQTACRFLMHHGNAIKMTWSDVSFDPTDKDSMLISEWPDTIGSVVAPVCRFIKEQIERHDIMGEPLRDAIPVGMCDRPGCGKFRLMKLNRPGHFFCSNLCKATFHQASKTSEERAQYMRRYRKTLDRNKPEGRSPSGETRTKPKQAEDEMSTYKRGGVYWYEFEFQGQRVRESTHQGNDKKARTMESDHRSRLADHHKAKDAARERFGCAEVLSCHECEKLFNADKALRREGNVFCSSKCAGTWGKARAMPTLQTFLDERFIPDVETTHKEKDRTVRYYRQGSGMLKRSKLAALRLDELTSEHVGRFAAEFRRLSPSGINMGLRALRRALNLAYAWGVIERPVKVELAKGETQRDRVLNTSELEGYLICCPQPWRDAATVIVDERMRPGEAFVLRWEHVLLGEDGAGLIRVVDGKSKAARRVLPMTPRVYELLQDRCEAQGWLAEGWVFPSQSKHGHLEAQTAKRQHATALTDSGVQTFVPYVC